MRLLIVVGAASMCVLPLACSNEPDPNDPSQFQGQYGYGQTGYGQTGYGQTGYGQTGYTQPTATAPTPAPTQQPASSQAQALPPLAAAAAQPLMVALAQREAPGMQTDGSPIVGNFGTGQTLEQPFQIQAGKCYSVIGLGLMGVTEVDVAIQLDQPPLPPTPLAQDQTTGPQAVLGGGGNCWRNPTPIGGNGKVVVKVSGGQGIVLAQLYSK
jgi:hypothetical protein